MNKEKKGIVFAGGGSKGSYEAGVCMALKEMNLSYDIVCGTSIGALCGAIFTSGDTDKLAGWIHSFSQDMVASNMFMFPNQYDKVKGSHLELNTFLKDFSQNGPSISPLKKNYAKIFDFDRFKNSNIDYVCNAFDVTNSKPAVFYKKDMKDKEDAMDKFLASAAYFPAFNFVKIADSYYADGGYYNSMPYSLAEKMGADSLLIVSLAQPEDKVEIHTDLKYKLIRPLLNLHYYLDFDAKDLYPQYQEGYLETLKYFNKAPGYIYTFYEEDWSHMVHLEKLSLNICVEMGYIYILEKLPGIMDEIYQYIFGYIPAKLENKFSNEYIVGRLLEVFGLMCGIDYHEQMHFKDFFKQILDRLNHLTSDPNDTPKPFMYHDMEIKGLRDMVIFFHTAILSFGKCLPKEMDGMKKKFLLPYYLAYAWFYMDKYQLIIYL